MLSLISISQWSLWRQQGEIDGLGENKQLELMGAVCLCQDQPWTPKNKSWVTSWPVEPRKTHNERTRANRLIYNATTRQNVNFGQLAGAMATLICNGV